MTTKENFYLNYSLPKRPKPKKGALLRLDPIKKIWVYYYPKYINYKTDIDTEIFRRTLYKSLRLYFITQYAEALNVDTIDEPEGIFDRWCSTQLQLQICSMDPLLPTRPVEEPRIIAELRAHNINEQRAKNLCKKLCLQSSALSQKCYEFIPENNTTINCKIIDKIYVFSDGTNEIKLSQQRFEKLKSEYNGSDFNNDVYCLLLRYDTLGGNGMQAAVPPLIMDSLRDNFNVVGECFASPLNHYFPKYCSAFPDTDACFNSMGSFFNFYPTEGVYEANPPFMELIMQRMVEHMEEILYNNPKVGFVIVIPKWSDDASPMWALLINSPYLLGTIDIDKRKHKYLQGYQHVNFSLWVANHITSIFVLKGAKCPISDIRSKLIKFKQIWERF